MTKLLKVDCNWTEVKNSCRTTVNKDSTEKEPSKKFKTDLLISEHSPIRLINIKWSWSNLKSWIATHFSRHKWECFISTQRTDRTGVNRDELPQSELVRFEGYANAQHLIDTARKRLCFQSSKETRERFEDLKVELYKNNDTKELSNCLVPNCVYRCGCPEFKQCSFWKEYLKNIVILHDIRDRYDTYNLMFKTRFYK